MKKLLRLFWEFFKISLLVIGGGYVIIAVADDVCSRRGWIREGELLDHLPVFQMVPGLIATHSAVFVGNRVAGALGAAVGVFAVALPSIVIFTFVAAGFDLLPVENAWLQSAFTGLRAALAGVIAATVIRSWRKNVGDVFSAVVLVLGVAAIGLGRFNIAIVLAVSVLAGLGADVCRRGAFRASLLPLLLFLKYGSLCFGGGFVIVPMYIEDFVGASAPCLQLPLEEFANVVALSQMTPGPIGVNGATFFGYRLGGVGGALLASAFLLLPGSFAVFFVLKSLERFRESRLVTGVMRGVRPASTALMVVALCAFAKMSVFRGGEVSASAFNFTAAAIFAVSTLTILRRKMNAIALIWLCAFAATALRAETPPLAEITSAAYPDADSVLVDETERVRYNPDGTYVSTDECWTKILTERGRREESTVTLGYSKRYGEGAIEYVGAIGTNGVERRIDVSATTKESTDNGAMAANIYDPLDRRIVCTVPGLAIGETLHVKTRRVAKKPRCEGKWADISVMEWAQPIVRSTYVVEAPKELPLKKISVRHPLGNLVSNCTVRADGGLTYTFVATNSAQVFPEPSMPALHTQVQNVRVSTAESWQEISRWYWELSAPHLARTNAAMAAKVAEIKSGCKGRDDFLRAVFRFVSQEVRYMGLTMEDTSPGYAPHDVNITFDNRYGVCRDKAALLVAMLRLAGFRAFPVLIQVGTKHDAEVPQPFFNHAIVAVEGEKAGVGGARYALMDPTDENAKDLLPSYLCNCSYLVCRPEGENLATTPVPPPERNRLDVDSRGTLARDGSMFVESSITMNGIDDTAFRHTFVKMKPEDRVKLVERVLKATVPGAELVRCSISPADMRDTEAKLSVEFAAKYPECILRGESEDSLDVPFVSRVLGMANRLLDGNTALVQRKYPLAIDTTALVSERFRLDLGGALGRAKTLPKFERGALDGYRFDRTFAISNGTLFAGRTLTVADVEFSPAEYSELREELKRTEAAERERTVFAKDPLAEADVRYFLDSSETTLFTDRDWVTTNRVVKEVLTYKGKKSSAELSFGYNPTWKHVEVVSATVSNRSGRVHAVKPAEMNVMDCGWAAAAPRYPAGRQLIVNLPSVEIGSVISYTVVTTVTNAPVGFYGTFRFDAYEPVERKVVRVGGWRREARNLKRLPNEPSQPAGECWRDQAIVSSNRFEVADLDLREVTVPGLAGELKSIRDWMSKYVKIAGPSVYELPLERQLTPPDVVLKERYATRLDYVRTLASLLRGAGYEADVVLAAGNAADPEWVRRRDKFERPHVAIFSSALCRVRIREGGFLGLGASERTVYLGTENQYAEIGASAYEGSDWYAPESGEFGVVTVPRKDLSDRNREESEYTVREDGAVDLVVSNFVWGSDVAAFRKRYAEILPEQRFRRYQAILGGVAQAATATSELVTDVESYPAVRAFSCYVPELATVQGDTISLAVPPLVSSVPSIAGTARRTPFALGACDREEERVTVRFPAGYAVVEHLPEPFVFADPLDPSKAWVESTVEARVVDGTVEVVLARTVLPRLRGHFAPSYFELVRDWSRIASARANRTIVVRRGH